MFILTFRAIVQLGIRCCHLSLVLHTHSGIYSHHLSSFWCSESLFLSLVIQSHSSWHSYSLALHILPSRFCIRPRFSSPRHFVLITYSSCSFRLFIPLHMIWSIEFTTHISVMLLGALCLVFLIRSQLVSQLIHVHLVLFDWESNQQNL